MSFDDLEPRISQVESTVNNLSYLMDQVKVKLEELGKGGFTTATKKKKASQNLAAWGSAPQTTGRVEGRGRASEYNNNTIYSVGDWINFNGEVYEMVNGVGQPGYAPDRPDDTLWKKMSGGARGRKGSRKPSRKASRKSKSRKH